MSSTPAARIETNRGDVRQQAIHYLRLIALLIFPLFIVVYIVLYLVDRNMYLATLGEEDYLEQLTVVCFILSGAVAFVIFAHLRRTSAPYPWFFLAFGIACIVFAMEEINWGQRIVGVETPEFFSQHSDQNDINLHNLMQGLLDIRTKDIAGIVLLLYGGILPFFASQPRLAGLLRRFGAVVPPRFLTLGFILGATLMLDVPTTDEEELGEFLFSLCFLIFMVYEACIHLPEQTVGRGLDRAYRLLALALPVALALVAFGVQLWGIATRPLYLEEAALAAWAQAPLAGITGGGWQSSVPEPVVWLTILRGWTALAGQSEFALRFLPAAAGTLNVLLFWKLLAHLRVQWVVRALVTLALMLSPFLLFYSQHSLAHNFTLLFALLSLLIAAKQIAPGVSRRGLAAWILANWLMLAFNPYTVLVLVGELLWLMVGPLRRGTHARPAMLWVGGAFLVSLLPAAVWLWWPAAHDFASATLLARSGLEPGQWGLVWEQAARLLQGKPAADIYRGLAHPLHSVVFSIALLALFTAGALAVVYVWRRSLRLGVTAMALVLGLILWGSILHYYRPQRNEFREVATYLETYASPDHGILLQIPQQVYALRYYLGEAAHLIPVPEIDLMPTTPGWAAFPLVVPEIQDDQILDGLQRHPALWLVHFEDRTIDPHGFVRNFLGTVGHHTGCVVWPTMEVCGFISPHSILDAREITLDARFGDGLLLERVALSLPEETTSAMPYLLFTLQWIASQQPATDYKISLRLVDEAGTVLAQQDDLLVGPLLPPTTWPPGETQTGHMALHLSPDLAPGRYQAQALAYDGATGAPVEVQTADGAPDSPLLTVAHLAYDQGVWSHD